MKTFLLIIYAFRDLIIRYLPNFKKTEYAFAFLVHPRNINDLYHKYPFFRYLPEKFTFWFLKRFWPVVVSEIEGLKSLKDGQPVRGFIMTTPLIAEQMLENKELAIKKILQALKLAEKMGIKLMGLGAFNSSVTNGGALLLGKTKIAITNGNSLTAAVTIRDVENLLREKETNDQQISFAVIGATGSIGQAVAKHFAEKNLSKLILVGKTPDHLTSLEKDIKNNRPEARLLTSTNIAVIREADIIVVATASADALIKSDYLKQNAIVYDVSQPRNTDPEIATKRPDISTIDGGLISTPGINYHFNLGLPREVAFACLAETMILAAEETTENYSIGAVEPNRIEQIRNIAKKYRFTPYKNNQPD
ncbi:MAG: hypothetical protein AUK17_02905 [Parcubacteria group bacterium CG2_30_44_18]|nr:MAG: hypothetical protein AUK17_02905 [Parcubacteria group bacterium CG2_30_44_18]